MNCVTCVVLSDCSRSLHTWGSVQMEMYPPFETENNFFPDIITLSLIYSEQHFFSRVSVMLQFV